MAYIAIMILIGILSLVLGVVYFTFAPDKKSFLYGIGGALGSFVLLGGIFTVVVSATTVPPGEARVGVLFGEPNSTYDQGFHWRNPMETLKSYKVRRESIDYGDNHSLRVLTKDHVNLKLNLSVPYRLEHDYLPRFHSWVGTDYREELLYPLVRSAVRDAVTTLEWTKIGADDKGRDILSRRINEKLQTRIQNDLMRSGFNKEESNEVIRLFPVQLRSVKPPKRIEQAVEEKMAAQEDLKRQETLTEIAKEEANRRSIKGQGVTNMVTKLPDGFTAAQISQIVSAMAERQRANAMMKAVEMKEVNALHIYGDVAPGANPNSSSN